MDPIDMILKFSLTFLLALLFGLERQRSHKPIGFGTFIFVSLGSCGLALVAISLVPANPLPLMSGIITGIGFLGAGALIKTTDKIFGFTTAASIWIFAIIGVIIAAGMYLMALSIYVLLWAVVFIDHHLESIGMGSYQKKVTISTKTRVSNGDLERLAGTNKIKVVQIDINKKNKHFLTTFLIESHRDDVEEIIHRLINNKVITLIRAE